MSWTFTPVFDAAHRAALGAGKPLVYVCPPAGWAVAPLFAQLPLTEGPHPDTLVLVPDPITALELEAALGPLPATHPSHAVTGYARTGRLIRAEAARTLIATPSDAVELLRRSLMRAPSLARVVMAWPELADDTGATDAVDTLLAEAGAAQRLVVTTDEGAVAQLTRRHAHRAPVLAAAPAPEAPTAPARYAVVTPGRVAGTVRRVLDSLDPEATLLWDPRPEASARWRALADDPTIQVTSEPAAASMDLALAVDLPSANVLGALAAAREVVVLIRPFQYRYLRRIARPVHALRLPSEADQARDRLARERRALRGALDAPGELDAELLALAPLFEEYDPAVVAAALRRRVGPGPSVVATDRPAWVRLRLNVGQRDRVRTADVVGALLNAVGLPKDDLGRVTVRETFTLVEVRAEAAERTLRGVAGVVLKGRRVAARVDRR